MRISSYISAYSDVSFSTYIPTMYHVDNSSYSSPLGRRSVLLPTAQLRRMFRFTCTHNLRCRLSFPLKNWGAQVYYLTNARKDIPTMDSHCGSRWRCLMFPSYKFWISYSRWVHGCFSPVCIQKQKTMIDEEDNHLSVRHLMPLWTPAGRFVSWRDQIWEERTMPIWSRFCCFHFYGQLWGRTTQKIQTLLAAHSSRSEYSAAKCASRPV